MQPMHARLPPEGLSTQLLIPQWDGRGWFGSGHSWQGPAPSENMLSKQGEHPVVLVASTPSPSGQSGAAAEAGAEAGARAGTGAGAEAGAGD